MRLMSAFVFSGATIATLSPKHARFVYRRRVGHLSQRIGGENPSRNWGEPYVYYTHIHTLNDIYSIFGSNSDTETLLSQLARQRPGSWRGEACRTDLEAFLGPDLLHGLEQSRSSAAFGGELGGLGDRVF